MNTTLQLRIDKATKNAAKKVFEEVGLDMSSGVKVYLKHVARSQSIPFEIRTANGFTREQEKEILKETEWTLKHGKAYSSAKELHDSIFSK